MSLIENHQRNQSQNYHDVILPFVTMFLIKFRFFVFIVSFKSSAQAPLTTAAAAVTTHFHQPPAPPPSVRASLDLSAKPQTSAERVPTPPTPRRPTFLTEIPEAPTTTAAAEIRSIPSADGAGAGATEPIVSPATTEAAAVVPTPLAQQTPVVRPATVAAAAELAPLAQHEMLNLPDHKEMFGVQDRPESAAKPRTLDDIRRDENHPPSATAAVVDVETMPSSPSRKNRKKRVRKQWKVTHSAEEEVLHAIKTCPLQTPPGSADRQALETGGAAAVVDSSPGVDCCSADLAPR